MNIERISQSLAMSGLAAGIGLCVLTTGCAATKRSSHLPEEVRSKIGKVAVIASGDLPREDFVVLKQAVADASVDGSTDSLGGGGGARPGPADQKIAQMWKQVAEAAWSEGWQMPSGAGVATAALVNPFLGALVNLSTHAPVAVVATDERKRQIEAAVAQAYSRSGETASLAERISSTGRRLTGLAFDLQAIPAAPAPEAKPDHARLGASGADLVLEIGLRDIGFIAGSDDDPVVAVFLLAGVRVVGAADNRELLTDNTAYVSQKGRLSAWLADDAVVLRNEIEKARAAMAEWIVEKLFLLQVFHAPSAFEPRCMLEPDYPKEPYLKFGTKASLSMPTVDSLQPVIRWETFPRELDRTGDRAGLLAKVSDITYDLKIWKIKDGYPEAVVYERTGILAPVQVLEEKVRTGSDITGDAGFTTKTSVLAEHRLESALDPSTIHFWSVRARFKLEGKQRVTRWSYSRVPAPPSIPDPCTNDHISLMHYYRFKTPAR